MKSKIVLAIFCAMMAACSSTFTLQSGDQVPQTTYKDESPFYRIETEVDGITLGQGYLRSFESKCFLVTAAHTFNDGHKSVAVNRNNNEIPIDLNQNYKFKTSFSQIDTRIFDVTEFDKSCPKRNSSKDSINIGQPLRLKFNKSDTTVHAIDLSVVSQPGIENVTFDVKVTDESKLEIGHSGSVVLSNGSAVGMLIQIKNGIGVVQPIETIDTMITQSIKSSEVDHTLCQKYRYECVGGGVLGFVVIAALIKQWTSKNGGQGQTNKVILTVPIP